jgi:hypothetical protein
MTPANKIPPISEAEARDLAEDLKSNGQRVFIAFQEVAESPVKVSGIPVVLLDGRSRLDAYEANGLKIDFEQMLAIDENGTGVRILWSIQAPDIDPYAYAISANVHRRQLTAEQKRDAIAKVLKARPGQSDRAIAKQVKRDHKTVGKVRKELEDVGTIPHVDTRTDSKGRQQPATRKMTLQVNKAENPPRTLNLVVSKAPTESPRSITFSQADLDIARSDLAYRYTGNIPAIRFAIKNLSKHVDIMSEKDAVEILSALVEAETALRELRPKIEAHLAQIKRRKH